MQGRRQATVSSWDIAEALFVRLSLWNKDHKETGTGSTNQYGVHVAVNGYKSISDFRKDHSKVFREVFRRFEWLLKQWNLAEGKTIAIDSFKIRASNSLKKNYNEKKLRHHLD